MTDDTEISKNIYISFWYRSEEDIENFAKTKFFTVDQFSGMKRVTAREDYYREELIHTKSLIEKPFNEIVNGIIHDIQLSLDSFVEPMYFQKNSDNSQRTVSIYTKHNEFSHFIGGKLNQYESNLECLKREFIEEIMNPHVLMNVLTKIESVNITDILFKNLEIDDFSVKHIHISADGHHKYVYYFVEFKKFLNLFKSIDDDKYINILCEIFRVKFFSDLDLQNLYDKHFEKFTYSTYSVEMKLLPIEHYKQKWKDVKHISDNVYLLNKLVMDTTLSIPPIQTIREDFFTESKTIDVPVFPSKHYVKITNLLDETFIEIMLEEGRLYIKQNGIVLKTMPYEHIKKSSSQRYGELSDVSIDHIPLTISDDFPMRHVMINKKQHLKNFINKNVGGFSLFKDESKTSYSRSRKLYKGGDYEYKFIKYNMKNNMNI